VCGVRAALPVICGGSCRLCGNSGNRSRRNCRWNLNFGSTGAGASTATDGVGGSTTAGVAAAGLAACPFFARCRNRRLFRRCGRLDHHCCRGRRNHDNRARAGTAPAGALATTAPAVDAWRCWRSCGLGNNGRSRARLRTILRGAGDEAAGAAVAGVAAAGATEAGAAATGVAVAGGVAGLVAGAAAGLTGKRAWRASSPPLSFWPEWPSSHRRVSRCARVDLRDDGLARRGGLPQRHHGPQAWRPAQNARDLLRLVRLKRAGVRLDASHAEFRKHVDNRPRLNF